MDSKEQFQNLKKNTYKQKIINEANKRFGFKTTIDELKDLFTTTKLLRWFFALFSIVTGASMLFFKLDFMPSIIAYPLSIILLISIELLKHQTGTIVSTKLMAKEVNILVVLTSIIVVALFSSSVFMSVNGTKELINRIDTSISDYKSTHRTQSDSLDKYYTNQIEQLKSDKNHFVEFNKVYVNKKIGSVLRYEATKTANQFESRIEKLENEKSQKALNLLRNQENVILGLSKNQEFDLVFWVVLSVSVEILIILCIIFISYYQFQVYSEENLINPSYDLQSVIQYVVSCLGTTTAPAKIPENLGTNIGFQNSGTKKDTGLIDDIRAGERDSRKLMSKHHVNVTTLNKYIKKYG